VKKSSKTNPEIAPSRWQTVAEIFLIVLVFYLYAGGPTPDVNEAHYLTKAKHYWNPAWCAGDHFLESADAHSIFYWTVGWLTLFLPLSVVAWIGRVLVWGLLAWSWQRLSFAVVPKKMVALFSAAIFLTLLDRFHMASEWIVGGVEAKGFAYAFVFLAIEAMLRSRWKRIWPLLGIACAFHVLVGGWSVLAAGFAWLLSDKQHRTNLRSMLPSLLLGGGLSLLGVLPALALTWGVDAETIQKANAIYVFGRLPHHLVFHWFFYHRWWLVLRFLTLLLVWGVLGWLLRGEEKLRRLNRFVTGAVLIAIAGLVIDQATAYHPNLSAALLRFYWYRLSDAMVPVGLSLAVVFGLEKLKTHKPNIAPWAFVGVMLLTAFSLGATYYQLQLDRRPGADRMLLKRKNDNTQQTEAIYRDWRQVCSWIAENTPPDACFLTPRSQQSFKWYSGRSEVATWKDVPQDAVSLVEWRERNEQLYPERVHGLDVHSDARLQELGVQYNARYLLVDRRRFSRPLRFQRIYPSFGEKNASYEVYLLPPQASDVKKTAPTE